MGLAEAGQRPRPQPAAHTRGESSACRPGICGRLMIPIALAFRGALLNFSANRSTAAPWHSAVPSFIIHHHRHMLQGESDSTQQTRPWLYRYRGTPELTLHTMILPSFNSRWQLAQDKQHAKLARLGVALCSTCCWCKVWSKHVSRTHHDEAVMTISKDNQLKELHILTVLTRMWCLLHANHSLRNQHFSRMKTAISISVG